MGGGKSSSSSSTDQAQTTLSADGVITGQVFNVAGKENTSFTYTDQFPKDVADIVNKVIDFATDIAGGAQTSFEKAIDEVRDSYKDAKQPDAALVKQTTSYLPLIVGGALITIILVLRK